jgi:hypothetical protein
MIIFAVHPEVSSEVIYPLCQQGYLHPSGSGITLFCLVLLYKGLLPLRPLHLFCYLSLFFGGIIAQDARGVNQISKNNQDCMSGALPKPRQLTPEHPEAKYPSY